MADLKTPNFEAQHYTFMASYNAERAQRGVYWHFSHLIPGTGLGLAVTPAVDEPDKWFLPFQTRLRGITTISPGRVQKADGLMMFDIRTEGQSEDAYRRLRVATWLMRAWVNNHEDYDLYLQVSNGWVPSEVPDIWVPTPNGDFAIYDPDPEDLPQNVADGATDDQRNTEREGQLIPEPLPSIDPRRIQGPYGSNSGFAAIL